MPGGSFEFDRKSIDAADHIYYQDLPAIDLGSFAAGVLIDAGGTPLFPDRELREVYSDALFDLSRLLEEIRFEISWASLLLTDWLIRDARGEVERLPQDRMQTPFSAELLAALAPYALTPPSPTTLLTNPHQAIGGLRHLSRWAGAQLLDSALLREVSALDRVATMLHLRATHTIPRARDGSMRLPGFTAGGLAGTKKLWGQREAWGPLYELLEDPLYDVVRRYRNGNVHSRRWPAELHGESQLAYWDAGRGPTTEMVHERHEDGLPAQHHQALLLATWDHILKPAIAHGGSLLNHESD
jgi:hypothetical protein